MPMIPARRIPGTIIEVPAQLQFDGPLTTEDQAAIAPMLGRPAQTFADLTAPIDALCWAVIEKQGGRRFRSRSVRAIPPAHTFYTTAGCLIPGPRVDDASPCGFAIRILNLMERARATEDPDQGKIWAWQAGSLAMDAYMTFKWGAHAVRGERVKAGGPKGGKIRGMAIAAKASTLDQRIRQLCKTWQQSDELQDRYNTAAEYVQKKTGIGRSTVYRRMRVLKLRPKSQ